MANISAQQMNYLKGALRQGVKMETVAAKLGLSVSATRKLIKRETSEPSPRSWTPAKDRLLKKLYVLESWDALLSTFAGHSQDAIRKRANLLNVKRDASLVSAAIVKESRAVQKNSNFTLKPCMSCNNDFLSDHKFNRICKGCKQIGSGVTSYKVAL